MDRLRISLVFLTGFMGSGKTTIGPILANTLGYQFIDIDQEIERLTGKSVSEIFHEQGEEYFRDLERAFLRDIGKKRACVVALGGGTLNSDVNVHLVKSTGILVYLRAEPEQIFRRMKSKTNRPLLRTTDGSALKEENLHSRIESLLTRREPYYLQADVIIPTGERRVGLTVDDIVRKIKHLIE